MDDVTYRRLRKACADGDHATLHNAGWLAVHERLCGWFNRKISLPAFEPYLELLRHYDPAVIMRAMVDHAEESKWLPTPAELRKLAAASSARESERAAIDGITHDRPRPDQTPRVFLHIARLIRREGHKPCSCPVRSSNWFVERLDGTRLTSALFAARARDGSRRGPLPEHVIRCPICDGIELGQLLQASVWWEQEGKHAAS
jgi:hypothetical protein